MLYVTVSLKLRFRLIRKHNGKSCEPSDNVKPVKRYYVSRYDKT